MLFEIPRTTICNSRSAVVWLRVCSSLAWLDSAFIGDDAKFQPRFLQGPGLVERIHTTFVHTAIDARVAHLLNTYVVAHAALFAVLIAIADALAGVSLAFGILVRVGASVAIVRALTNIIVAGGAGTDTIGYNLMLIVAAVICIATAAGRKYGVDAELIERFPRSEGLRLVA